MNLVGSILEADLNNPPTAVGGILNLGGAISLWAGLEQSTNCRWWDFGVIIRTRPGLSTLELGRFARYNGPFLSSRFKH